MTPPAGIARPLARARREHRSLEVRLSRIERAWLRHEAPSRSRRPHATVIPFPHACERSIRVHLAEEETAVYPRLHEYLPDDTGTLDAALREHDTLRELVGLLRQRSDRFVEGDRTGHAEISVLLHDLIALWQQHARHVDDAIAPLVSGWWEATHG